MVDIKLLHFIKDGIKKGYSHTELKSILKENGWDDTEIESTLTSLKKPRLQESQPLPIQKSNLNLLNKFIKTSLQKGAREHEIRLALLSKGWPVEKINKAFIRLKENRPIQPQAEQSLEMVGYAAKKPLQKKETIKTEEKPKTHFKIDGRKILIYILSFILITAIISGTFSVFYFMLGINSHEGNCNSGLCADTKDYAMNYAIDNMFMALIISSILAFAVVLTYAFIPNKDILLWIVNLFYLLFTLFIAFLWLKFVTK
ncbi:hypothetical protein HOD61_02160 [archaeon]|jgi:hypothetical protein|nr:hypothetical protein [archaeon]